MEAGLRLCDQVRPGPLPSDVLEFRLENDAKLIVRPSGTEPKLKVYLSVRGADEAEALRTLDTLDAAASALLDERSAI